MLTKKVLLITYHFPPSAASGTFRLLGFTRHLPTFGWQPLVVAPPSLPWEPLDPNLCDQVPPEAIVASTPYPIGAPRLLRMFAQNAIWLPRAWSACKRVIKEHRPDVILTSGPPHCVHVLGHHLKRSTGLPWVADFRDPWISDGSSKRLGWRATWERRWERRAFEHADVVLANAPNATRMFQETYPSSAPKIMTLTNGFDARTDRRSDPVGQGPIDDASFAYSLVHAGEIYAGRNPLPLFEAIAQWNAEADGAGPCAMWVLGRNDTDLNRLLRERGWSDHVHVVGQCSYGESLRAMDAADVLVLFDTPGRRIGVPAKLYEYFRAGRPILALAEHDGDTANILRASGVMHRIASPTNIPQIRQALRELVEAEPVIDASSLKQFTRENLTRVLASRLDALVGQRGVKTSQAITEPAPHEEEITA